MSTSFDQVIDRRNTESVKWHHFAQDVLPMWVADMDLPSPEPVTRALAERVAHGVFGYGVEPPELRGVIVERLLARYGWQVEPDALVFMPGVITGFNQACRAFTSPGDGILCQTPVYPPILSAPGNAGCTRDEMKLTRGLDGRYEIDLDAFERAITGRTRLFILCNPHNPVGRVFTQAELTAMAEICARHDVVICSDEIHCDLVFGGSKHIPIASLAPEIAARTVTLMAPSKTYNIAGLECSLAIVQDPDLRKRFRAAGAGLVPGVNILGFVAALAAYQHGQPWLDELLAYLECNRDVLLDYVHTRLPDLPVTRPEGTYLAWLDCRKLNLPKVACEWFIDEGRVAMNDGATFGKGGDGFVRLNFGCPRSMLIEGLDRMKAALDRRR